MFALTAFSLGFLGSFHCVGMCGPIAMALPVRTDSRWTELYDSLIYHAGKILTYSMMGLVFGMLGKGFVLAGWQSALSVILGVVILLMLVLHNRFGKVSGPSFFKAAAGAVRTRLGKLFSRPGKRSILLIGILNGLLPCGLVYLGIAGATATGSVLKGAMFMACFGLGTMPVMLFLTLSRRLVSLDVRKRIRKLIPVFTCIMAVMLILRGLNLGIPYLSPSIQKSEGVTTLDCCEK